MLCSQMFNCSNLPHLLAPLAVLSRETVPEFPAQARGRGRTSFILRRNRVLVRLERFHVNQHIADHGDRGTNGALYFTAEDVGVVQRYERIGLHVQVDE